MVLYSGRVLAEKRGRIDCLHSPSLYGPTHMPLRYSSGEEIMKGDRILFAGDPATVELIADPEIPDPDTRWYVEEFGQGIMISEPRRHGSVFASDPESDDELEFVSRALAP